MGQIVTLQDKYLRDGYKYELPEMPTDEKEIYGYDRYSKDQVWRIPQRLNINRTTAEIKKIEYINEERRRWREGFWFFNKGIPTYITGMHYDHLVNMYFEFGHALYFDSQRLDFYFRDLVRKDPNCYGALWLKPRRYGMTAEEITQGIYTSMEDFNRRVGQMSNESRKAVDTLFRPTVDSLIKRPMFMRPRFYTPSGKKPRTELEYISGVVDLDVEFEEQDEYLGGGIKPYTTTPAAMDGKKEHYITMDEVWKWMVASPKETLDINKKCVEDFGICGKISMLSTMGDSDDYASAIKEGIDLWHNSNPEVRDDNGRTNSGLYRYFVSAIHSKVLPHEFTDKHGFVDEDRATTYIMNDRKKLDKNSKNYVFELRRMPLNPSEALSSAATQTLFSRLRIQARLGELNALTLSKKPYVRGNLKESAEGLVYFEPDALGIWKMAIQPFFDGERGVDTRNRFKKFGDEILPPINPEGCIGYDPVRYADTTSDSISKAAIIVRKKFDYYGGGNQNRYQALCHYRPEDPEDAHYEAYKASKFFGYQVMHERQVESVERRFRELHALSMLMKNEKDGKYGIWTDNNRKVVKNGVDMVQAYWKMPQMPEEEDFLALTPFEELLLDADDFDILKTTKSDVMMSNIMLEYGSRQVKETNLVENNMNVNKMMSPLFPKRN